MEILSFKKCYQTIFWNQVKSCQKWPKLLDSNYRPRFARLAQNKTFCKYVFQHCVHFFQVLLFNLGTKKLFKNPSQKYGCWSKKLVFQPEKNMKWSHHIRIVKILSQCKWFIRKSCSSFWFCVGATFYHPRIDSRKLLQNHS